MLFIADFTFAGAYLAAFLKPCFGLRGLRLAGLAGAAAVADLVGGFAELGVGGRYRCGRGDCEYCQHADREHRREHDS